MIPENPGIRRFVWEHLQNMNRILHRMRKAGGTFSGKKGLLCAWEFIVVGHLCTPEGCWPDPSIVEKVKNWQICQNVSKVHAFLGTVGVGSIYIPNFACHTNNLVNLIVCRLLGGCRPLPRTEHMGDAVQYSQVKCACGSGVPSPNTTTAASVPIAPYLRISIFAAMGTQLVRPMYLDSSHVDLGFVSRELQSP